MPAILQLHSALLRVLGLSFVLAALAGILVPVAPLGGAGEAARVQPIELLLVVGIFGVFLLLPFWLPRSLLRPVGWGDMAWIAAVAAAAWPSAMVLSRLGAEFVGPAVTGIPAAVLAAGVAALAALAAVMIARPPEPAEWDGEGAAAAEPEHEPELTEEDELFLAQYEADVEAEQQAANVGTDPKTPARNAVIAIHLALLAVAGIAILMTGAGIFRLLQLEPQFFARTGQGASIFPVKIVASLTILAGLSLFVRRAVPRPVAAPVHARDMVATICWLLLLAGPAIGTFVLYPAFASNVPVGAAIEVNLSLLTAIPGATLAGTVGLGALGALAITGMLAAAMAPRAGRTDAPSDAHAEAAPPPRRPAPLPRAMRRRPLTVRLIIRLFALADWIVLRLIGFALLGGGYLIGLAIAEERAVEPAALTWEQDPMHALGFYGAFGLVLAVPVLLPRSILVPSNLFKGLIKSALVAAGAVAALPALAPLATLIPPDTLPPEVMALLPQAPLGLQAMAAYSIFCALVAGLAGQFGRKHRLDYLGNPVIDLTPDELRQLRAARMGANA